MTVTVYTSTLGNASVAIGSVVEIPLTVATSAGVAVDPDDVIFEYKRPDMITRTERYLDGLGNVTRSAAGNYSYSLILNVPGLWYYKYSGAGDQSGTTGDLWIRVDPTQFGGNSGSTGP